MSTLIPQLSQISSTLLSGAGVMQGHSHCMD